MSTPTGKKKHILDVFGIFGHKKPKEDFPSSAPDEENGSVTPTDNSETEGLNEKTESNSSSPSQKKNLTEPSIGMYNDDLDNCEHDLILRVNDVLAGRYKVIKMLGKGVYGQVVHCLDLKAIENKNVAVKIIKNHPDFNRQAKVEINILETLNFGHDVKKRKIVKLIKHTKYLNHILIVTELLGANLYELLRKFRYIGLPLDRVRDIIKQILDCLEFLDEEQIIHCDLKPENILISKPLDLVNSYTEEFDIKVIDFGSATKVVNAVAWYIQSRFYRAPEVILGLDYDCQIDMWSLACVAAELYLGIPIFASSCAYDQLGKIVTYCGPPPNELIESSKNGMTYFEERVNFVTEQSSFLIKNRNEYMKSTGKRLKPPKIYFREQNLKDLIMEKTHPTVKIPKLMSEKEKNLRSSFLDFLSGLFRWDACDRWSASQAKGHPFITGEKWIRRYIPPFIPKYGYNNHMPSKRTKPVEIKKKQNSLIVGPSPSNNNFFFNNSPSNSNGNSKRMSWGMNSLFNSSPKKKKRGPGSFGKKNIGGIYGSPSYSSFNNGNSFGNSFGNSSIGNGSSFGSPYNSSWQFSPSFNSFQNNGPKYLNQRFLNERKKRMNNLKKEKNLKMG